MLGIERVRSRVDGALNMQSHMIFHPAGENFLGSEMNA